MSFSWSHHARDLLRQYWSLGISTSEIADRLGHGCTKNAVIGKARREKLPIRCPQNSRTPEGREERARKRAENYAARQGRKMTRRRRVQVERTHQTMHLKTEIEIAAIREADQRRQQRMLERAAREDRESCRYPLGDPKHPDFHFCAEQIQPGSSYCPVHHAVCWYTPVLKAAGEGGMIPRQPLQAQQGPSVPNESVRP